MYKKFSFFMLCTVTVLIARNPEKELYTFVVIGAGPAGIIASSVLLEKGVASDKIIWIDPEFKVGRLGKYYGNVPSNLKAYRYTKFLSSCSLFDAIHAPSFQIIQEYDQQQEPQLQLLVDLLQAITDYIRPQVTHCVSTVKKLTKQATHWSVELLDGRQIRAQKVILAYGAHPKRLHYPGPEEISLDVALDEKKLQKLVTRDDVVMVVGSAHSALLVVKYLSDMQVKKVVNIYTQEPTYGSLGGLEGITARWTKALQKKPIASVVRIPFDEHTIQQHIADCTKIIYAIGYEPDHSMLPGSGEYNATGKLAPHLYGIGIAFPEYHITKEGKRIKLIGVNSFMSRAQECISQWINEKTKKL